MTDPDREHTTEPAEGADRPGQAGDDRTPHSEQPAEGADLDEPGAQTPETD